MNTNEQAEIKYKVELEFDGKPVPMVPYVKETVTNVVLAMVKAMRGYTPGMEVKIVVRQDK